MKINTVASHHYASQSAHHQSSTAKTNGESSFAAALSAETVQVSATNVSQPRVSNQADFTNMSRQQMFDWMNSKISSGEMSLDESLPFVGMTIKISAVTGQQVDMSSDAAQINFLEKARQGLEGALSRNDKDLAERLQTAISIMNKNQGKTVGANAQV